MKVRWWWVLRIKSLRYRINFILSWKVIYSQKQYFKQVHHLVENMNTFFILNCFSSEMSSTYTNKQGWFELWNRKNIFRMERTLFLEFSALSDSFMTQHKHWFDYLKDSCGNVKNSKQVNFFVWFFTLILVNGDFSRFGFHVNNTGWSKLIHYNFIHWLS